MQNRYYLPWAKKLSWQQIDRFQTRIEHFPWPFLLLVWVSRDSKGINVHTMLPKPIGLYQMQVWKPIIRQFHEVVRFKDTPFYSF